MNKQNRALAMHDIFLRRRCSLTVALPIISRRGRGYIHPAHRCAIHPIPEDSPANLSGSDRGYPPHCRSLGEPGPAFRCHLYRLSGFPLNRFDWSAGCSAASKKKDTLALVDPPWRITVCSYRLCRNFPLEMKTLCAEADIIVLNITEAALMLEEPYQEGLYPGIYRGPAPPPGRNRGQAGGFDRRIF